MTPPSPSPFFRNQMDFNIHPRHGCFTGVCIGVGCAQYDGTVYYIGVEICLGWVRRGKDSRIFYNKGTFTFWGQHHNQHHIIIPTSEQILFQCFSIKKQVIKDLKAPIIILSSAFIVFIMICIREKGEFSVGLFQAKLGRRRFSREFPGKRFHAKDSNSVSTFLWLLKGSSDKKFLFL